MNRYRRRLVDPYALSEYHKLPYRLPSSFPQVSISFSEKDMVNAFIMLCKYYNPLLTFFQLYHVNLVSFLSKSSLLRSLTHMKRQPREIGCLSGWEKNEKAIAEVSIDFAIILRMRGNRLLFTNSNTEYNPND